MSSGRFLAFLQRFSDRPQRQARFRLNPMDGASLGSGDLSGSQREPMTERAMAPFQTNPNAIPEDMVTRVGSAAGLVARIQQEYTIQVEAEPAEDLRQTLASKARAAAERAIDEQGISVQDYNAVLTAAEHDQDLERRLLDAAREVL
jgi:hypothetical protein